ncbi:MAG: ABC transporter ATP-binding protein [Pseudomonadota bacterium]
MTPAPLLDVENLSASLPTDRGLVHAVSGVSFSVMPGKTLAIVGESGCGKSMLGRAIMGLLPKGAVISDDCVIRFEGRPLQRRAPNAPRPIIGKDIAMVFQDPMTSLNPVMTVGGQITEGIIHHLRASKKDAHVRAMALMTEVGINMPRRRFDQYPHQLSGGLRQRVAIAIALACRPELIIADEPTTALDVTVQADILDLLSRLQAEKNMTMILISHNLGVVAGRAHDTAVMYAGKLVEMAPTPLLFRETRMPYTHALLSAIPRLTDPPHAHLNAIDGMPPDLIAPPAGCGFAPRCQRADRRCHETAPPMGDDNGSGHRYACWHPINSGSDTQ